MKILFVPILSALLFCAGAAAVPELQPAAAVPPAPELTRELDLVESRMRERLLAATPMPKEDALALAASLKPDGTFPGIDYKDENRSLWKTAGHLGNARRLALAWASPNHPLYHDKAVGEAVVKAVGWWSSNRPQSSNWWWNDMSVPQTMTPWS